MKLLAFCLLLGMSAQAQTTNLTATTVDTYQTLPLAYTFADGYCSLGEKIEISHGNGDKETIATCGSNGKWWKFRDETGFAEAAQRAADETDGKGYDDPPHKPWDEVGPLGDGPNPPWPPYEPVDVPAVHHKHIIMRNLGTCSNSWAKCIPGRDVTETKWTCADKSRVLLTSEDGKKHCIKF